MANIELINSYGGRLRLNILLIKAVYKFIGIPHLGTRIRLRLLSEIIKQLNLRKNDLVLDAGCGYGFNSLILAKRGFKVAAVDKDNNRLKVARALNSHPLIEYRCADLFKLPFKSNSFDLVICLEVLEHLKDDSKALRSLRKVIKNKGFLILSLPGDEQSEVQSKLHHLRSYNFSAIANLANNSQFKIKMVKTYGQSWLGNSSLKLNDTLNTFHPLLASSFSPILYLLLRLDLKLKRSIKPGGLVVLCQR